MKTYFLLIGLQVGWTGQDPGQVQLGLGQLHYSMCLFTQGLRLKKQPLFGACLLMAESIILREWGEAYSASWSLCLGHYSGPSTTFFRSKHVTWPSPKSENYTLYPGKLCRRRKWVIVNKSAIFYSTYIIWYMTFGLQKPLNSHSHH